MKLRTWLIFILILILYLNTKSVGQDILEIEEVSYNLFAIENPEGGNIAFLVTRKGIVVVDAGASPSNADKIINTIRFISKKPIKYIILTHMHSDHINGLSSFPDDIVVISHTNLERNNLEFNHPKLKSYVDNILPSYISTLKSKLDTINNKGSEEYKSLYETYKKNLDYLEDVKRINFRKPDITFDDYYMIKIAGERIMLEYPGPCHTNDNIIVKFSNHNVIHTGDIVFNKMFPYTIDEHGVDIYNWVETLNDLYKENIITVIPGHGEIDNKYVLKDQANYFKELAKKIESLKNDGFSLDEIISRCKPEDYDLDENKKQLPVNIAVIYNQLISSEINWWQF